MFVCMDAIRRERLSLGELLPVGRLRGVRVMYMSYFAVTPLRHRCAMPPAPGRLLLPYGQFTLSPRGEALLFCSLIFYKPLFPKNISASTAEAPYSVYFAQ